MNNPSVPILSTKSQELLEQAQQEITDIVEDALQKGTAIHEVEQCLFKKVLEIGHHRL
jgi:hypothetical protein